MKKNHTSQIMGVAAVLLAGIISGCSPERESVLSVPGLEAFSFQSLTNSDPNIGINYGYEIYTNSAGSKWITPSNGVASFTFSDVSGIPAPYDSVAIGIEKKHQIVYGTNSPTNSVTLPVTANDSYWLAVFVKNVPPPPTNGQTVTLQLQQNP